MHSNGKLLDNVTYRVVVIDFCILVYKMCILVKQHAVDDYVSAQPHHIHVSTNHNINHHLSDPNDPFEPFAENEADFQPIVYPLPVQPARLAVNQHPTAQEAKQIEEGEEESEGREAASHAPKLEIQKGNQHISEETNSPSLTFTSPKAVNSSTSIQVNLFDSLDMEMGMQAFLKSIIAVYNGTKTKAICESESFVGGTLEFMIKIMYLKNNFDKLIKDIET